MGAYTVNLDKCISRFENMGQIEDSVVATIAPDNALEYPAHQEYGFQVRRKDGSLRFVEGKWYMLNSLNRNRTLVKDGLIKYIKEGVKSAKAIALTPYITKAARMIQRTSKMLAPVDTGRLRGSITVEVDTK